MPDIDRYTLLNEGRMDPASDGEWIYHDDHIAALEAVKATVKPLKWEKISEQSYRSETATGLVYIGYSEGWSWGQEIYDTLEEAQAAYQKLHEARLAKWFDLVPSPALEANQQFIETLRAALQKIAIHTGHRPCDCERCYCGKPEDAAEVAAWDERNAFANIARAALSDNPKGKTI